MGRSEYNIHRQQRRHLAQISDETNIVNMNKIDQEKTNNLAAGGRFNLDEIPVRKIYDQAQQLDNVILPKIALTRGKDSEDYKFWQGVYKSLLYAVMILDRDRWLVIKLQQANQLVNFYKTSAETNERELLKYTTIENVWASGAADGIAADIGRRVDDLLTNK